MDKSGLHKEKACSIFNSIDSLVFLNGLPYSNPSLYGKDLGCIGKYQALREEIVNILERIKRREGEED